MKLQKVFGSILTLLGVSMLIFSGYAFLQNGTAVFGMSISQWEAAVPFIIGVIFFSSGIKLISSNSKS